MDDLPYSLWWLDRRSRAPRIRVAAIGALAWLSIAVAIFWESFR